MEQILEFIEFNQYNLPLIIEFLGFYILILWLAVVAWVLKDITTRSNNLFVIVGTILLILVGNIPALVIYLLIRPSDTINESKNKDLFYSSILDKEITACPDCGSLVRHDFKFCPSCSNYLVNKCPNCGKQINSTWHFCINCNHKLTTDPALLRFLKNAKAGFKSRVNNIKMRLNNFNKNVAKRRQKISASFSKSKKKKAKKPGLFKRVRKVLRLPKLPKIKIQLPKIKFRKTSDDKLKVVAAKKDTTIAVKKEKPENVKSASEKKEESKTKTKSKSKQKKKKRKKSRGRPKGSKDSKPRKKRSDAGKKRGSYDV